ncbi:MAG: SDR family oxidoreductase [Byssovorax sp.]
MPQVPIAIVGVSALFAGSTDTQGFFRDILAGRDLITDVPPTHWLIDDYYDPDPSAPDKTYSKRGAFLADSAFDPLEFGVPPSIVPATDTSQLLALIVAQRVLDDATRGRLDKLDRDRASVILGVTSGQELLGTMVSRLQRPVWLKALRDAGIPEAEAQDACDRIGREYVPWQESSFPGLLGNVVAGRIANRFDLRGTNCVTDAACASALSALSMGISELATGQSDLVIAGGVDTMNDIFMYMCFSKTPALSPTGDCRPFSQAADGTILGEGLAMVALKRLADAERDGDRVYAVIRGVGSSSDGRSKSVYAPLPEGQARALRRAYEVAGYGPETVELVEAHGTATKAGDVAEFAGLKLAFGEAGREDRQWCALGSVKSQIGHTKSAAGAAGLFKAVMALHHKVLLPTIKVEQPNPALGIDESPFYLNTVARPWIRDASHPRRASVSSFGFGGSNFHVTLEEYGGPADRAPRFSTRPTELVVLSAESAAALADRCDAIAKSLTEGASLADIARRSQDAFRAAEAHRLAVPAASADDLAQKLADARGRIAARPGEPFSTPAGVHHGVGPALGPVAFLFPGQGSQYVGMGADLAISFDAARSVWDEAASARFDGRAVHEVVFPIPVFNDEARRLQAETLTRTEWAQPAIGLASLGLLRIVQSLGVTPLCVGGHSFGEITALAAAGALDPESLVTVARRRGELMRDASAIPGAMTALPCSLDEARALLAEAGGDVVVANHNHPAQVVVSGPVPAIEQVEKLFSRTGKEARRLPVATAFHSPLVAPSCARFAEHLAGVAFAAPTIDVWSNAEAAPYPASAEGIRERLAAQIGKPVRFVEQIEGMWEKGARIFLEVGPGAVLTELCDRILDGRPHLSIALDRKGKHGASALLEALGRLSAAGVALDFAPLWAGLPAPSATPKKKPAMTIALNGSNHGKPYPPRGGSAALPRPNPPRPVPAPVVIEAPRRAEPAPVHASPAPVAPAPIVAAPPQQAPLADAQLAWVQAYQASQQQASEAHAAYLKTMADTHATFLRTMESSFAGLGAMVTGAPLPIVAHQASALSIVAQPAPVAPPVVAPLPAAPPPVVVAAPAPAPVAAPIAAPPPAPAPTAAPKNGAPAADLAPLLLSIVADKTGYPAEMLALPMELEADLGIDSIKRVEILAAMREKAPGLPEVKAAEMAALRTLGQIVDYLREKSGAMGAAHAPNGEAQAPSNGDANGHGATNGHGAANGHGGTDLAPLLLSIVADKTGYPAEMLALPMELEADLGIDSIKRVEILSAMREKAPGLPEVKAAEMAALRTLGQIVDYLRDKSGMGPKTAPAPVAPVTLPQAAQAVPQPAPSMVSSGAMIGRWVAEEVAAIPSGLAMAGLLGAKRIEVTDEGTGVAAEVVRALAERGLSATVVKEPSAAADALIFLGGLRPVASIDEAVAVDREAFRAAKIVAPRLSEQGGALVLVQDTGGDFGLSGQDEMRAYLAGISALARTAALEWPKASVKAIDLARGGRDANALARALTDELLHGGGAGEIGLHADGKRTTIRSVLREVGPASLSLGQGDVVLVSGGARGVTAASVIELCRRSKVKVALLGRSRLDEEPAALRGIEGDAELKRALLADAEGRGTKLSPADLGAAVSRVRAAREVRSTLAAIEATGAEARYLAADVQDREALTTSLAELRKAWGPVTVLVHGAGVLADRMIADKTAEQFDRVFDTKVLGLRALLDATSPDPLRAVVLFSSVAARAGNRGQCDYAMANEVLNRVGAALRRRSGQSLVVKAIGWGPWQGGMVTPSLEAHFAKTGVPLLPLAEGARRFTDELLGSPAEVETVIAASTSEVLPGLGAGAAISAEIAVSHRTHPYLADHRIGGRAVVPVAMALAWMTGAVRAIHAEIEALTLRDVKVLRGIKLEGFDGGGDRLVVVCTPRGDAHPNELSVELRGAGGALHYSAIAAPAAEHALAREPEPRLGAFKGEPIYDGHVLFHGPSFQVIREIAGVSREGIAGALRGAKEQGWPSAGLSIDPAPIDGALQLALLWARDLLGGATLPMGVGAVEITGSSLPEGSIRCVLRSREVHASRALCDVSLADAAGRVFALLRGVEVVLRPGESPARRDAQVGLGA